LFTLINKIEDLSVLNQEFLTKPFIAVDTEFRRTTKDNMRLSLLQINDGEEIYLIDAIAIGDPGNEANFLNSTVVTKIFHSCKEDLEAVYSWTKERMENIYDTQIANSFLNGDYSISYQALVENELGIFLDKKETRSNWIRRPLSDAQLKYAALDVEYLIHLYSEQKNELIKSDKLEWLEQDIEKLINQTFTRDFVPYDIKRCISKSEEDYLLKEMNKIVLSISSRNKINPTLFFSKKNQKDFLRKVLADGIANACSDITMWRRDLIEKSILDLLK
tara:strand:- start:671 stop:1498 length:828 start_codon:yes stop_codon:yes gene_type:complete